MPSAAGDAAARLSELEQRTAELERKLQALLPALQAQLRGDK
jgi:hypothetical protein